MTTHTFSWVLDHSANGVDCWEILDRGTHSTFLPGDAEDAARNRAAGALITDGGTYRVRVWQGDDTDAEPLDSDLWEAPCEVARWDQYVSFSGAYAAFARTELIEAFGETITADMEVGIKAARETRERAIANAEDAIRAVEDLPEEWLTDTQEISLTGYADRQVQIERAGRDLCTSALESIHHARLAAEHGADYYGY